MTPPLRARLLANAKRTATTCPICGATFDAHSSFRGDRGGVRVYCSKDCSVEAKNLRARTRRAWQRRHAGTLDAEATERAGQLVIPGRAALPKPVLYIDPVR